MGPSRAAAAVAMLGVALAAPAAGDASRHTAVTVEYATPGALRGLDVAFRVAPLHVAQVRTASIAALRGRPGILRVEPVVTRMRTGADPARPQTDVQPEWQYAAMRANLVPASVRRAAARITIAVVDTGADLSAPDLAAKTPTAWSVISNDTSVTDRVGHGTFVSSLAAGAVGDGNVLDGLGGDARLMVVQAASGGGDFTDASEAAAIVWAVDHGARIVNLSLGGFDTSQVERDAIEYAAAHGVLLVAAAGNQSPGSTRPMYPAALVAGVGLVVGASTSTGARAPFSSAAAYVDLLAPGQHVLGALSSASPASSFPRARLPDSGAGLYGYGSGTSYAAPEVAGAAALVWAANPALTAGQVIRILEQTASRASARTPGVGYGVVDVAAAVAGAERG